MDTTTEDRTAVEGSFVPVDALVALADNEGRTLDADYVSEAEDRYMGEAESLTEWAEEYAEDTGMLAGIPSDLRYYFDFGAWVRDAELCGDITAVTTAQGVAVFHC